MKEIVLLLLAVCCCCTDAAGLDTYLPFTRKCNLKYNMLFENVVLPCNETRFQTYPGVKVNKLLGEFSHDVNNNIYNFLDATKNCQTFHDNNQVYGKNDYYSYTSICKTIRRDVRVLWSHVEGYIPTPAEQALNGGLLPVHVVEGQNLYDIDCVHPWSEGQLPIDMNRRLKSIIKNENWNEVTRHLCRLDYLYNRNFVCKPSGYINRDILVYSEHANKMFIKHITRVPTACSCTKCKCTNQGPVIG